MGYYVRVLGTQDPDLHIDEFLEVLNKEGLTAKFELDPSELPNKWTIISILNQDGEELAQLERNPISEEGLGREELEEFKEEVESYEPKTAAKWLKKYFDKVKVIYAFQMLNASFTDDRNFEIISCIKTKVWNRTKGILQADNEGFTNEDGYHILWQFSDNVTGNWLCSVQNWLGQWKNFEIDLGDLKQRLEFKEGKVPTNAKRL